MTAESLYEAVAQGLLLLRDDHWNQDGGHAFSTVVVRVKPPEVEHTVHVREFVSWLNSAGKSPAEMALKARLRNMLGGT